MMHFKNHKFFKPGFTLIETLLALVIVGAVLTPVFLLFGTITQRMNRATHQLYALLQGKQLLYEARQKQEPAAHEFSLAKRFEESEVDAKYVLHKSVNQQSSLASFTGLHKEDVTMTWKEMGQDRTVNLIAYVYKQPEQKKS